MHERAVASEERLQECESELVTATAALERSRLLERQAVERAQEYRTRLEVLREFGSDDFMQAQASSMVGPRAEGAVDDAEALQQQQAADELDRRMGSAMPDVLVAVELNLGFKSATLSVAPWHTPADYGSLVGEFLSEHGVRHVFAEALVRYLEEVEDQATSFPFVVQAELSDVYSKYG